MIALVERGSDPTGPAAAFFCVGVAFGGGTTLEHDDTALAAEFVAWREEQAFHDAVRASFTPLSSLGGMVGEDARRWFEETERVARQLRKEFPA